MPMTVLFTAVLVTVHLWWVSRLTLRIIIIPNKKPPIFLMSILTLYFFGSGIEVFRQ